MISYGIDVASTAAVVLFVEPPVPWLLLAQWP